MGQRLDQMKLRCLDPREYTLGDALVVHRVGNHIAPRGALAVAGQLQIDDHGLRRAALPVDETDDAFDGQAAQENAVLAVVLAHAGCGLMREV